MREIKFRAWAEHTIDNRWNYAWNKSEEIFSKTEPSKHSEEWSEWYDKREDYRNDLLMEWDSQYIVDRYVNEKVMITNIMVNGTVQRPHGYEIIDVMQYTGLKDKNGKEIYDGDIVTALIHNEDPFTHQIIWRAGILWFGNWNWIEFQSIFRGIEVVGNIYENPELLIRRK